MYKHHQQQQRTTGLNIDKLQHFATENKFMIQRYFTLDGVCCFIEMLGERDGHLILIYLPPGKFKFTIPDSVSRVFDLVRVDHCDTAPAPIEDAAKHYATVSEDATTPAVTSAFADGDMEANLTYGYEHDAPPPSSQTANDRVMAHRLYKHLKRLAYSIKGERHRIAVMHDPFLGMVSGDRLEEPAVFTIQHRDGAALHRSGDVKDRLCPVVEFGVFYDNVDSLGSECDRITDSVLGVLTSNHDRHSQNVNTILSKRDHILGSSNTLKSVKQSCAHYIEKYTRLLQDLQKCESEKEHELTRLNTRDSLNLQHDMKQGAQRQRLERDLASMMKTKRELLKTLVELREKNNDVALKVDSILFDNIIMMDRVFSNLETLDTLMSSSTDNK